jgi:hypothetical protein
MMQITTSANSIVIELLATGENIYQNASHTDAKSVYGNSRAESLFVRRYSPSHQWTSPGGLLLAFGTETKAKTMSADGMILVKFQQWRPF